ncbi:MAG: response regulator transcription factor [Candidatus Methanosuratus sp.]|nr:response regulator transcription factor [Candidatus Methanosuratincola sp.]
MRLLLEQDPTILVTGEAASGEELLEQIMTTCPDLILLDWELPGPLVEGLLAAIHDCCPNVLIIALSGRSEARHSALAAGVDVFVSKGDPPEHLLEAIGICRRHRSTRQNRKTSDTHHMNVCRSKRGQAR